MDSNKMVQTIAGLNPDTEYRVAVKRGNEASEEKTIRTDYELSLIHIYVFQEKLGDDYYPMAMLEYERMLLMVYYLESKYGKDWVVDNVVNYTVDEVVDGLNWINSLEENHVMPKMCIRDRSTLTT